MTLRRVNQREFRTAVKGQLDGLAVLAGKQPAEYQTRIPEKRAQRKPSSERGEADVNDEIRDWQFAQPNVTLWRNNRGVVELDNGGRIKYGVGPNGASDWIGFVSVTITPAMLGKVVAIFAAVEAKAPKKGPTDDQITFIDRVLAAGGRAGVARSADDAEDIIT